MRKVVCALSLALTTALTSGSPIAALDAPISATVPRQVVLAPKYGAVQFVYVANSGDNSISAYRIKTDGSLVAVPGSPFAAGSEPEQLTIDPGGKFLYARGFTTGIYGYRIDSTTGALAPLRGSPFAASMGPGSVVIDPTDKVAYANNLNSNSVTAYSIHATSGALVPLPGSPLAIRAPFRIVLNPRRKIAYVVTRSSIETFATAGDSLRQIAKTPKPHWLSLDIAVDHQGKFLYLSDDWTKKLYVYRIGATLGEPILLPRATVRAGLGPRDMLFNARGNELYVCNVAYPQSSVSGYSVDSGTGLATSLPWSPFNGVGGPQGIAITPSGRFMYVTNFSSKSVSGLAIGPTSGVLKAVPGSPFHAGRLPWGVTTCRRSGNVCKPSPP
jgi:6-phosphogluconolactonase